MCSLFSGAVREMLFFFFLGAAATGIYTEGIVGGVGCVYETAVKRLRR